MSGSMRDDTKTDTLVAEDKRSIQAKLTVRLYEGSRNCFAGITRDVSPSGFSAFLKHVYSNSHDKKFDYSSLTTDEIRRKLSGKGLYAVIDVKRRIVMNELRVTSVERSLHASFDLLAVFSSDDLSESDWSVVANCAAKSPDVETKAEVTRAKSPDVETKAEVIRAKSPDVETKAEVTREKSPDVETKAEVIREKSPDVETKAEVTQSWQAQAEPNRELPSEIEDVHIVFRARYFYIAYMRDLCDKLAIEMGFGQDEVFKLKLAMDEVLTNAIEHGCSNYGENRIDVKISFAEDGITVRVRDSGGKGFDDKMYRGNSEGEPGSIRSGLCLVDRFTDIWEVHTSPNEYTEVVFFKRKTEKKGE